MLPPMITHSLPHSLTPKTSKMLKRSRSVRQAADAESEEKEEKTHRTFSSRKMWCSDSDVFSRLPLTDVQKKQILAELGCTTYKTKQNPHPPRVA